MNITIARVLGCWQTVHAAVGSAILNKWAPFALACGVIVAVLFSVWSILPFGLEAMHWGAPMLVSAFMVAWALFWPLNCATWFGWIAMLFRLVFVLAVSNVIWVLVAVLP